MQFVALDLETTGLSTETDTIIEIAAIRFEIERIGDIYTMIESVEHSQLIHPGRVISKEVTMITGITPEMLIWKPDFESVRDRVREFIGDAVIVGHNVLFDIAMLRTHGIDLSPNTVIDTFELSEIFSQDIESLNLGFLASRYGLIDASEEQHRALTDTRVSIRLMLRYLGEVRNIEGVKRQIWDTLIPHDEGCTLSTISSICHEEETKNEKESIDEFLSHLIGDRLNTSQVWKDNNQEPRESDPILIETHGNPNEELSIIQNAQKEHEHLALIVPWYKTAVWMSGFLEQNGISNMISISPDKWCSVEYMRELFSSNERWGRKKLILILKIAYWLTDTDTGLLDEMKFYGEERTMLDIFRARSDESSIWRSKYEEKKENTPVLISDAYNYRSHIDGRYPIIKDIPLLEDIIRRRESREISFDQLYEAIMSLWSDENIVHMTDMISIIRGIYESIPDRPTGELASPPGAYGETYFVTQAMLWHRWYRWLIHATQALELSWTNWKNEHKSNATREQQIQREYIEFCTGIFGTYHSIGDSNTNIILTIQEEKTRITLIPNSVINSLSEIMSGSTLYGVNISFPETREFLMREYDINTWTIITESQGSTTDTSRIIYAEYHAGVVQSGTVILTTSQKHARDLGQELRKIHGKNMEILIQWLSWGKWKMLSTFQKNIDKTILIVLMESWRDEYELWKCAKYIIITKLPFDPPTDPYFLARTVGMSNNFSQYSEPIVTIRLNTLIARIQESGYTGHIVASDARLNDTEWGKRIQKELL